MIDLKLNLPRGRAPRVLCIGAHCDDIEIGCGGTLMSLLAAYPKAHIDWVVLSSEGKRAQEAQRAAAQILKGIAHQRVHIQAFRGAYFPSEAPAIKEYFEQLKRTTQPNILFTHSRDDLHQDHRIVGELTWNTFRNHMILEYEIPKYDGGLGSPQVFMPLTASVMRKKVSLLMRVFRTQHSKQWFTPETFQGLMRLRGVECNAPSGYAEAFYVRKLLLGR